VSQAGVYIDWGGKKAAAAASPPVAAMPRTGIRRAAVGAPGLYALATALLIVAGVAGVWRANVAYAPEMYSDAGLVPIAEALAEDKNYAVFDLNINIRKLREEHVARFTETPDVVLLGASHWQEAHAGLVKSGRLYNGHVHRDYWEDMLGEIEVYARNHRLPRRMIVSIRDNLFTPVASRTDFLWEPGIPNYRAMADRLGLAKQSAWSTYPYQRIRERLSLDMLFANATRWNYAKERPHPTLHKGFQGLDTLLPDGSIVWSAEHRRVFTPERTRQEALAFAARRRNDPPQIDPAGVVAVDRLLAYLKRNGTEVVLVHPPFNPIFYEQVRGGTYFEGLDRVREVARKLAADHGLKIIGDFDPAKVGCTAEMYIDAEHANPGCLAHIFEDFDALHSAARHDAVAGRS
jgi:hypothetical protein